MINFNFIIYVIIIFSSQAFAINFTKCSFNYCTTLIPADAELHFANTTNLPAKQYMLGTFSRSRSTILKVDLNCPEVVAWVMRDSQYIAMKNGACTYSNGDLTGCEYYHVPVASGELLSLELRLTDGPGENLNFILYNPTENDCFFTHVMWKATQWTLKMVVVVIFPIILIFICFAIQLYRMKQDRLIEKMKQYMQGKKKQIQKIETSSYNQKQEKNSYTNQAQINEQSQETKVQQQDQQPNVQKQEEEINVQMQEINLEIKKQESL